MTTSTDLFAGLGGCSTGALPLPLPLPLPEMWRHEIVMSRNVALAFERKSLLMIQQDPRNEIPNALKHVTAANHVEIQHLWHPPVS